MTHVLDNPVWQSLHHAHRGLARIDGRAAGYDPEVAQFVGIEGRSDEDWADLRRLIGAKHVGLVLDRDVPNDLRIAAEIPCHQMIAESWEPRADDEMIALGPDDVPDMLDLTSRTKPGPFERRTIELGAYVGLRIDGRLVAMAGERMHPPGFTEISAVCTDPEFTGRGYAARAMATVGAGIVARGEIPFLHVAHGNPAKTLYEKLGFTVRRDIVVRAVFVPPAERVGNSALS